MPEAITAVVTGGSGFIGRRLIAALQDRGVQVTSVDLRPFGAGPIHRAIEGDLRDVAVVRAALSPKPDVVFHLAARTSVVQSSADPQGVFENNVAVTQSLLEHCRLGGVKAFVLASTNAVAGAASDGRLTETSLLRPLTPYGATKAAGEMLLTAYGQSYGIAAAAVRLTNVYGPGMADKDSFVIRLFRAAARGTTIRIHGGGALLRDYVFVDDAVAGFLLAWDRGHLGPLIIGSGQSIDLLEVHRVACAASGRDIRFEHVQGPPGEMKAVRIDFSLAQSLGYRPSHDFPTGMAATWKALQPTLTADAG